MALAPRLPEILRFGTFEVDLQAGELRRQGKRIKLQDQPFQVLTVLLQRPGNVVTREELRAQIWPQDTFVDFDNSLNTAINKLREALGDSADNPRFIETLPRRGYRFIAPVVSGNGIEKRGLGPASYARWGIVIAVVTVFAIGAASTAALYLRWKKSLLTEKDTIVLGDFVNTTGDPVFDETLKQGLRAQLEQSPFLNLLSDERISRTVQLMGRPSDARLTQALAREVCQRTASAATIEGSISTLGSQYVLGLKAVNCRTGDPLADEQVTASRKELVLRALDEAAIKMRERLGESLNSVRKYATPLEEATTPSLDALNTYSLATKALDRGNFSNAKSLFQRAITLDSNFAMAYRGLGVAHGNLGENIPAEQNLRKAYELRDHTSEREKLIIEASYHWLFSGDLETARRTFELMTQTYPLDEQAHFNLGNIYDNLGQYEKGLAEARECSRLDPESALNHSYLVYSYIVLNRLDEARVTAEEAQAKKLDSSPPHHLNLYSLAFMQNDSAEMARQLAWALGKPGVEDTMLAYEANTLAYLGRLEKARDLSQRAVASAEREGEKDTEAGYEAEAALREALFGNLTQARRRADAALHLSTSRMVQFAAALALSLVGDAARGQALAHDLAKRFPEDTLVKFNYVPTIQAELALRRGYASKAIEALQAASPYETGTPGTGFAPILCPVFVRGEAYLTGHQGSEAVGEFQKILSQRGLLFNSPGGALAHLQLGRAYALQGDMGKARAAYQKFLDLWKEADRDIPILKQAKTEYAKLR